MGLLSKAMGSDERISRFHSYRGDLIPGSELARLPLTVAERLLRSSRNAPWMARSAVNRLDSLLDRNVRLLELGSGSSTRWYAERVQSVVTLESDEAWSERTKAATSDQSNVTVVYGDLARLGPDALCEDVWDVVVVDQLEVAGFTRVDALRALGKRPRIVVLDDSDRPTYRAADGVMEDWTVERHVSLKSRPLQPTETTIFFRGQPTGG